MAPLERIELPTSTFVASRSLPLSYRGSAFDNELLLAARSRKNLVGALGFEPRTSGLKARCAEPAAPYPRHRFRDFLFRFDMALSC